MAYLIGIFRFIIYSLIKKKSTYIFGWVAIALISVSASLAITFNFDPSASTIPMYPEWVEIEKSLVLNFLAAIVASGGKLPTGSALNFRVKHLIILQ